MTDYGHVEIEGIDFVKKIQGYTEKFANEFGLHPVIGCELEFYASDCKIIDAIKEELKLELILTQLTSEQGDKQFELKFLPSRNIQELLKTVEDIKQKITKVATKNNAKIYFDARPFKDQPGSALHIHLNFLDKYNKNAFAKQKDQESVHLLYTVGGLLRVIRESMLFFAPSKESYKRYVVSMETPVTISWGGNNRTTALRIPPGNKGFRRIEHRVPSADANIAAVIAVILSGAYVGMKKKIMPPEKIYGNSFDEQYNLKRLPNNITKAKKVFKTSKWFAAEFI
jgi:glutamine synthetase